MLFRELFLPAAGLDGSCMLAQQNGLLKGTDFGHYLINTYGPLSFLLSGVFHPKTYYLSILFQVLAILIALWPTVYLRWGPRFVLTLLLCLVCNRLHYPTDPIVFAALFGAFVLAVLDKRLAALVSAAVIGVFTLSKWSLFFVALPLFALADIRTVVTRRAVPLQTATLLTAIVLVFVAAGQPIGSLALFARNGYEIASYFALAVTSPRVLPLEAQLAFVAFAIGLALMQLLHARAASREDDTAARETAVRLLVLGLGWLWVFVALYHASYVRPDGGHFYIGWNALLVILPVALFVAASLRHGQATLRRRDVSVVIAACAVFVVVVDYPPLWRDAHVRDLPSLVYSGVSWKVRTARCLVTWADPNKLRTFKRDRVRALQHIALRDMQIGRETIDVYPFDLAPVIAADLAYQPRPTMQAQVAYSPYLQRLDLEHWRGPNAPVHVLFLLGDIDGRMPTLALGPSVVELLSRYDPVDRVEAALHLRRRDTPRPVVRHASTSATFAFAQWVSIPRTPGGLTLARIRLPETMAGRVLNFVSPAYLMLDVKFAKGVVRSYRFVPSMAELGFAISPELESLLGTFERPARLETDLVSGLQRSEPAEEFQIREVGSLGRYAFDRGAVEFSFVTFQ